MSVRDKVGPNSTPIGRGRRAFRRALWIAVVVLVAHVIFDLCGQDYSSRYSFGFTAIGIWAFGVTASVVLASFFPAVRHRERMLSLVLVLYVGSYLSLTFTGGEYFSQSGQVRYSSGLSISDVLIWHPKYLHWEAFQNIQGQSTSRGTTLGYYYSPLIFIDRMWIHPTRQIFSEDQNGEERAK